MFDIFKIKLFGQQPVARISEKLLDTLVIRDYKNNVDQVSEKLKKVNSDSQAGKFRISACILKLANKDINALDLLIEKANNDSRDIIMLAEYPRCAKIGFDEPDRDSLKHIYIDDFVEYSNWLKSDIK